MELMEQPARELSSLKWRMLQKKSPLLLTYLKYSHKHQCTV